MQAPPLTVCDATGCRGDEVWINDRASHSSNQLIISTAVQRGSGGGGGGGGEIELVLSLEPEGLTVYWHWSSASSQLEEREEITIRHD